MTLIARVLTVAAVMAALSFVPAAIAADEKENKEAPKTEAIDFRKLKELLPEELGGLKRKEATGEKNKLGEISISQARGAYQKGDEDNAPRITVEIQDFGGMGNQAAMGMATAWTMAEIDKETDDGYEKTVKVAGNAGFETWNKNDKHGQVQLIVAKRFIVTVQTDNLPAGECKKLAEKLPLDKLAALK